jgi:hypothetical protein
MAPEPNRESKIEFLLNKVVALVYVTNDFFNRNPHPHSQARRRASKGPARGNAAANEAAAIMLRSQKCNGIRSKMSRREHAGRWVVAWEGGGSLHACKFVAEIVQ